MTGWPTNTRGRDAFTLVELLAVICILTLVAGATVVNLGAVRSASALADAAAGCRRIDALARLHSRRHGSVVLDAGIDGAALAARDAQTGEILSQVAFPDGIRVSLGADVHRRPIVLDRTGAGPDYTVRISIDDRDHAWLVRGLTGRFLDAGASP